MKLLNHLEQSTSDELVASSVMHAKLIKCLIHFTPMPSFTNTRYAFVSLCVVCVCVYGPDCRANLGWV